MKDAIDASAPKKSSARRQPRERTPDRDPSDPDDDDDRRRRSDRTGDKTAMTRAGVAAPHEMRETTSHKVESTAIGEDAQHARSTQTRKLPKKKSSHAE